MASKRHLLRFLLIATCICTAILVFSTVNLAQASSIEQLNQEGFALLEAGAAAQALSVWQEAEALSEANGDEAAIVGTQLNQSLAEQALGLYPRACSTVTKALTLPTQICQAGDDSDTITHALSNLSPTNVTLIGVRILGESLALVGNLTQAQAALSFAQNNLSSNLDEAARVALALGNVHRLLIKKNIQTYELLGNRDTQTRNQASAQISAEMTVSISQYRRANASSKVGVKANLNLIDLFVDIHTELPQLQFLNDLQQLDSQAQSAYENLQKNRFADLPTIDAVYGQLNLAENLMSILQHRGFDNEFWNALTVADIEPLILTAIAQSERIADKRALSFAFGMAADLKQIQFSPIAEIKESYGRALALAQSVQAFDSAYQWAYRLGQIEAGEDQKTAAEQYYANAIAALEVVREDLISVNTELRFDFKEKIEPVYRDYIKLLVNQGSDRLSQAVAVHDSLQLAQLENFLRCGRLIAPVSEATHAASVHVINLGDQIFVIVNNQKKALGYSVPAVESLQAARNLILNIQSASFLEVPEEDFLPYSQLLYRQLIKPAVDANFIAPLDHLSFILDAPFQSIPMGILHDGQQFLAAQYILSNAFRLQRPDANASPSQALFAGISLESPSFEKLRLSSLSETEFEAESISEYVKSKVLLNSDFTLDRLQQELAANDYQIVHISTHGQFSSVPEQTFLAAWDS